MIYESNGAAGVKNSSDIQSKTERSFENGLVFNQKKTSFDFIKWFSVPSEDGVLLFNHSDGKS